LPALSCQAISVMHVSSLMNPFSSASGVSDVVNELPRAMTRLGTKQAVVLPKYQEVDLGGLGVEMLARMEVPVRDGHSTEVTVHGTCIPADTRRPSGDVRVLLIEHPLFEKIHTRGIDPTFARYALLARSAIAVASEFNICPDIIHGHGRAGALLPIYLNEAVARGDRIGESGFVFSLHGRSDQGRFEPGVLEEFAVPPKFEPVLENGGKVDILKAAAMLADRIIVPSRSHLSEIVTPQFGDGLEELYAKRLAEGTLAGIPNGVGIEWDPADDPLIANNYSAENIAGKEANRIALKREEGLNPDPNVATMLVYSRLTYSKGIPRIDQAIGGIMELGANLVVMGDAGREMAELVEAWGQRYPGVRVHTRHDMEMAHRFLAGADILIHPSERETDALIPKMAVLYGLIPVVTPRGGMPETVSGVGFVTDDMTPESLVISVGKALSAWRNSEERERRIAAALSRRFDWESSAAEYLKLYEELLNKTPHIPDRRSKS
jgi:starch synthase